MLIVNEEKGTDARKEEKEQKEKDKKEKNNKTEAA